VRIFLAGASGIIGFHLVPLLVTGGHVVAGMTRSPDKTARLRALGAEPVVCDVFDLDALTAAVTAFAPDLVMHQLTDLPDAAEDIPAYGQRSSLMRTAGTRNLIAAASAAAAPRFIAQSISWELPNARARASASEHERAVLEAGGVVVRYGQLYGPGTYYEDAPPAEPRIHVQEAARQTMRVLDAPAGLTVVVDDRAL
jgi:nucleoside-diphosphate-sugar epimerase